MTRERTVSVGESSLSLKLSCDEVMIRTSLNCPLMDDLANFGRYRYTLMAFSYPEGLEGLPPGKLICDKLEETLRKRLKAAAQAEKWETVTVEYESGIVMDRFSL